MIESPLSMASVFHLGPVPVTMPVIVTWGIMAMLAGGSWLLTRRLALRPSAPQAVLELLVDGITRPDPRHDARGSRTLSSTDRHAVSVHPDCQLVLAGARHRAPDRAY